MDTTLEVNSAIRIPLDEFEFTYARSSGPGGQNVNKVNSKAVLHWAVASSPSIPDAVRERFLSRYHQRITTEGALVLSSERYRDQPRNVDDCLEKLREMLEAVARPPTRRRKTKPTRGSVERRLKDKKSQAQRKQRRHIGDD
jgi:ribosome-associated protein